MRKCLRLLCSGRLLSALMLCLSLGACAGMSGPHVAEMRMAFYPPRPAGCALEFVSATMAQMSPLGPYQVVGHLIIQQSGIE